MKKVVVECDPDEVLMKALGMGRKEIAHQNNKGEVCNYLSKSEIKIAVVDEDPGSGQPRYLQTFTLTEEKFGVRKLVQKNSGKIVLVIKPRLEEWILIQCAESNVDPVKYFLPKDPKRLKDVINLRLNNFNKLVDELKAKENNGIKYLQSVIEHCYK